MAPDHEGVNKRLGPNISMKLLLLVILGTIFQHYWGQLYTEASVTATTTKNCPLQTQEFNGSLLQVNSLLSNTKQNTPPEGIMQRDSNETAFYTAVAFAYKKASPKNYSRPSRQVFEVGSWTKRTEGGLSDTDRTVLAKIYSQANSVFEFGLGESTFIADHVGVPRYTGVDSDPKWIALARSKISNHRFRFYFADVGPTGGWGFPIFKDLPKNVLDYQVAPLVAEQAPFDVYLVDGRWRLPCLLISFLHASAQGANYQHTQVLVHDCGRLPYHRANHLLHMIRESDSNLCVFRRKETTTDGDLMRLWIKFVDDPGR